MRAGCGLALAAVMVLVALACGGSGRAHGGRGISVVRLPFGLGALSAQGVDVAVAPAGHTPELGGDQPLHAFLWNASTRRVEALKLPSVCPDPLRIVLAAMRVAVLCDDSCCSILDQRIAVLRPGGDVVSIMHATSSLGSAGTRIDGLAGGGSTIIYTVDNVDSHGHTKSQVLYRIDAPAGIVEQRAGGGVGQPLAVAGNRILFERNEKTPRVPVYTTPPSALRVARTKDAMQLSSTPNAFGVPKGVAKPTLLFDGRRIYGVNFFDNTLVALGVHGRWKSAFCDVGPGVTLGGVSGHMVSYTTADAVHVIRMTDCRDAVIAVGGGVPVGSALTSAGLFYAFNSRPTFGLTGKQVGTIRSTLTFWPTARVEAAVARGLSLK